MTIARALLYDPDIIIVDKPTGNLDGETENTVMEILKELAITTESASSS